MAENPVISVGLKLNDLAKINAGVGIVLLAVKDAGKNPLGLKYAELYEAVQQHLTPRLARYNIANQEQIVAELLKYLRDYQSVFTIAAH
ncbi:MAG: hypothetical protein JXO72_14280 [Vicinamibacteria bacterium]|nr:hypothetical protein [Vicinamibacteria bacterium]